MKVAIVVVCQEIYTDDEGFNGDNDDEGYRLCEAFGGDDRVEKAKKFVEEYFSVSDLVWESSADWEGIEDVSANTLCCNFTGTYPETDEKAYLAVYIHDETVK